ncbi:MAG TPA: glycosyltransferase family 39 protein [Verrucomicrobiae bacterium]|nr:glycosyltransferase family 39 protein [Verrucomicrobiae bacterium]
MIGTLAPFANKAIQTDDALFVWTGQWIQAHPFDFFGGKTNWWSSTIPMWVANWNPPLMSYFLAAIAAIFGWNEIPLHIACIGVAFAAAAGTYTLAKRWCSNPMLATVIAIFTPAFLVSSTTLMCDIPMFAFWVWSVAVFARALETGRRWQFALAGLLAALGILTKYSAVMLLPLLAAMGVLNKKRPGWWLLSIVVPLIVIVLYELLTARLYGHGLFGAAGRYAQSSRFGFPGGAAAKAMIGLTFAGGSLLPIFFLGPWLWPRKISSIAGIVIFAGLLGAFALFNPGLIHPWMDPSAWDHWELRLEVALLVIAGLQLIFIAVVDLWQRRDVISLTLFLWIIGVLIFAAILNWAINARSFLPAVPAAAILAVRRLKMMNGNSNLPASLAAPVCLGVFVALCLVVADYQTANATRSLATRIVTDYVTKGHQLWIEGHAGFQYYLQRLGGKSVDAENSVLEPGDIVAVSWLSGSTINLPAGSIGADEVILLNPPTWVDLSGANEYGLAGFYGADNGPVPFVIGDSKQSFFIAKVLSAVKYHTHPANEREVVQNGAVPAFPKIASSVKIEPPPSEIPAIQKEIELAEQLQQAGKTADAVKTYRQALDSDPNNAEALNNLAWILTTANDPSIRNGAEAVRLGIKAVRLTQGRQPVIIGTLAAAYAESGDFSNSVATAELARELAQLTGRKDIAEKNAQAANLYASGKTIATQNRP